MCFLLAACLLIPDAPAPLYRESNSLLACDFLDREYIVTWNKVPWKLHITSDGYCLFSCADIRVVAKWEWDGKTRTLTFIDQFCHFGYYYILGTWPVRMDKNLRTGRMGTYAIEFTRVNQR